MEWCVQEARKRVSGRRATLCVFVTVFILSFGLLPQAFADFSPPEEGLKVLGVGRIQNQAYITATVTTEERFSTEDSSLSVDESTVDKLATPLEREIPMPEVILPADIGVALSGEWQSGLASAYGEGFIGDDTAHGVKLTKESMGVAVDDSMDVLLGRTIEISYGGESIVTTITDTGPLFSNGRALDLQPGLWKAFGADSEKHWGVRSVDWRLVN